MTEEQWNFLTAKLSAIELLVITMAKTVVNQRELHSKFRAERIALEAALLQKSSDARLDRVQEELDRMEELLWGSSGH